MIIIGELSVVLAETVFYRMILNADWKKAVLFSVCCNAASAATGRLIF